MKIIWKMATLDKKRFVVQFTIKIFKNIVRDGVSSTESFNLDVDLDTADKLTWIV